MHRKGLSGVGVTAEPGGPLVANLSMSDLRGLTPERWGFAGLFCLLRQRCVCCLPVCRRLTGRAPGAWTASPALLSRACWVLVCWVLCVEGPLLSNHTHARGARAAARPNPADAMPHLPHSRAPHPCTLFLRRSFGALALPVGSFLLLQKGLGLRWEDCLTDQLPAAVKVGGRATGTG